MTLIKRIASLEELVQLQRLGESNPVEDMTDEELLRAVGLWERWQAGMSDQELEAALEHIIREAA
jgi:hypothetical protein